MALPRNAVSWLPAARWHGTEARMSTQTDTPDQPRISFVSLGCPKALVDSERIITQLRAEGYELTRSHAGADAVIVNTCAVTAEAVRKAKQEIRRLSRENPGSTIIVTGCAAQTEPETFAAMPEVDPERMDFAEEGDQVLQLFEAAEFHGAAGDLVARSGSAGRAAVL